MTTLDELGELWCALWMKELERGATLREYGYWEPEMIAPEMLVELPAAGIALIFIADDVGGRRSHTLELADDNGRVPDFTLVVLAGGLLRGSVTAYNCATADNPWDAAAAALRELLEAA